MRWFRQYVSNIPIIKPNKEIRKEIEELVDQIILAQKRENIARAKELSKDVDQIMYKLYELNEAEIKAVESQ